MLLEKLAASSLDVNIILGNFNFHHLVKKGIEAKINNDLEVLLVLVEQYSLHLLLKTTTIIYNKVGH